MKLKDLPDIEFVSSNKEVILTEVLAIYKNITGRRLAGGDPIRLFLLVITNVIILLLNKINETGKQNLLKYAAGTNLDHIGVLMGVARIPAERASVTVRFTLSQARNLLTVIPKGTRVTAGDHVYFSLEEAAVILPGKVSVDALCKCTEYGGEGNGYISGEINTLVDPIPYVNTVQNVTTSQGGAGEEDDEAYRERIQEAPGSYSCAGASNAYKFFSKKASAQIIDVSVVSPAAGEVVIYPLLKNGVLPETEILNKVIRACNKKHVRPLTDKVTAKAPGTHIYAVDLTYYIRTDDMAQISAIQKKIDSAVDEYILWQRSAMGRDINPSELIRRVMEAGAKRVEVTKPVYTKVKNGSASDGYAVEIAVNNGKKVTYGGMEDE